MIPINAPKEPLFTNNIHKLENITQDNDYAVKDRNPPNQV